MNILFYDIEVSPIIAATWGLYDQNITYYNVIQDTFIICASWRWEGQKKIYSISVLDNPKYPGKNPADDYVVVKRLAEVLGSADVIVGHNANKFDWKRLAARVVYHKLPPIAMPLMVDTLKEARKFKFTSNKLDDLALHLDLPRKLKNNPEIWLRSAQGDVKAIKSMVKYNRDDIPPLEELYRRLKPYMTTHPNASIDSDKPVCPSCKSEKIMKRGVVRTLSSMYQRYSCNSCLHWFRGIHRLRGAKVK